MPVRATATSVGNGRAAPNAIASATSGSRRPGCSASPLAHRGPRFFVLTTNPPWRWLGAPAFGRSMRSVYSASSRRPERAPPATRVFEAGFSMSAVAIAQRVRPALVPSRNAPVISRVSRESDSDRPRYEPAPSFDPRALPTAAKLNCSIPPRSNIGASISALRRMSFSGSSKKWVTPRPPSARSFSLRAWQANQALRREVRNHRFALAFTEQTAPRMYRQCLGAPGLAGLLRRTRVPATQRRSDT